MQAFDLLVGSFCHGGFCDDIQIKKNPKEKKKPREQNKAKKKKRTSCKPAESRSCISVAKYNAMYLLGSPAYRRGNATRTADLYGRKGKLRSKRRSAPLSIHLTTACRTRLIDQAAGARVWPPVVRCRCVGILFPVDGTGLVVSVHTLSAWSLEGWLKYGEHHRENRKKERKKKSKRA